VRSCTTLHEVGGCVVRQCPRADTSSNDPPETFPHAGVITYESPDVSGGLRIEPNEYGRYGIAEDSRDEPFGDAVSGVFRATGGDVPAFERRLDFRLRVILEEPEAPGGRLTISRGEDFVLRWSRGEPGMRVQFTARGDHEDGTRSLGCVFDAEIGEATIPVALLRDAPVTGSSIAPFVGVNTDVVQAGDYAVLLGAGDLLVTPRSGE
jgi:hypothetical protein